MSKTERQTAAKDLVLPQEAHCARFRAESKLLKRDERPDCEAGITQLCVSVCLSYRTHTYSVHIDAQETLSQLVLLRCKRGLVVTCIVHTKRFVQFLELCEEHGTSKQEMFQYYILGRKCK